jgi:hypothetical protein
MRNAPRMTRAHFAFIAETIANMPTFSASLRANQRATANAFASVLAETNPLFNRDKFLATCNLLTED